jgi:predicted lipoprotein
MKKLLLFFCFFALISCGDDDSSTGDTYDRSSMLSNWSDNIIIPAHSDLQSMLTDLKNSNETFTNDVSQSNLDVLRDKYLSAYKTWQHVMMFSSLGKAQELDLYNKLNRYPTNASSIDLNISSNTTDLTSVSDTEQGFPAIDYMLFGIESNDADILNKYADPNYPAYLTALVQKIIELNDAVLNDWNNGFRDSFVQSSGNTFTSSVNVMVNDYIFNYEKYFRTYKLGGPLGIFSNEVRPQDVEVYYGKQSKELCLESLDAIENFFIGKAYASSSKGASLKTYLENLDAKKDGEALVPLMLDQLQVARTKINELDSDFANQLSTDTDKATEAFDEMQRMIVYLKVDMLSAFNIGIDYVDNDGD